MALPQHRLSVVPNPASEVPSTEPARPADTEAVIRELLRRTLAGDMQAWGRVYQQYFDGVYRHLCYLTGDADRSEDLVQDTFARALASLRKFHGRSAFSTWLHGIAVNVVRKERDKVQRRAKIRDRVAEVAATIPQGAELERRHIQRSRAAALYTVLDSLPSHLRDAFVLRDLQGLSIPEVAAQLGLSEGNARIRAHRARHKVHDQLVAAGWIEPSGGSR